MVLEKWIKQEELTDMRYSLAWTMEWEQSGPMD